MIFRCDKIRHIVAKEAIAILSKIADILGIASFLLSIVLLVFTDRIRKQIKVQKKDIFISPSAFRASYGDVRLIMRKLDSDYRLSVKFGENPSITVSDYEDERIKTGVARLYNIVYEKAPKAIDYMLQFIHDIDAEAAFLINIENYPVDKD